VPWLVTRPPSTRHHPTDPSSDDVYEAPESLAPRVVTAAKWTVGGQVLREAARLGTAIFVARLLTPNEWGLAATALVPLGLLAMVTDLFGAALVQRARVTEADRSTVFWTALGLGTSITAFAIAMSGPIARFFGQPETRALVAVGSLTLLIGSLDRVPEILRTRELAFRSLETRQFASLIVGGIVAVALAFAGAGPWAIIANYVVGGLVFTALLWAGTSWRPQLTVSMQSLRSVMAFGVPLFGSQLVGWVSANIDRVLTGRHLGTTSLGEYSFAFALMIRPVLNIVTPLEIVMFPTLATIQADEERLRRSWLGAKRVSVAIMTPLFVGLLTIGPDLVPLLFGRQWQDTVPILQVLCLAGVAFSLGTLNSNLLMVRDKVGVMFWLALLGASVITLGVATGLHWGLIGVATGLAAAQWTIVLPQMWITTRAGSVEFGRTLRASFASLPFAAVGGASAWVTRLGLVEAGVHPLGRIVVSSLVLVVVYTGLVYCLSEPLRVEMRRVLLRLPWRASRGA
jgi:O-antigen/teichoic acid export membrane protein